jgi:ribosomal RNA assembly protein
MAVLFVRIPEERVAVVIGPGGATKRSIEKRTGAVLEIDAAEGSVVVRSDDSGDPMGAMQARDIVLAIGRGFSPERAARLLKEGTYLGVIDIKRVTGRKEKAALWRVRSRLIGTEGRARARIEELSGASVSVFGSTVALIGQEKQLVSATRAVELLLRGSEHSVVFHMLARMRRDQAAEAELAPVPEITDLSGEGE